MELNHCESRPDIVVSKLNMPESLYVSGRVLADYCRKNQSGFASQLWAPGCMQPYSEVLKKRRAFDCRRADPKSPVFLRA